MIRVRVTKALLAAVTGAFLLQFLNHSAVTVKAQPAPTDALQFFKNYFVTGDYVAGGVGLRGKGDRSGLAAGTIKIASPTANPIPDDADVVAAFLYWQVVATDPDAGAINVKFNGLPLSDPATGPFGKALNTEGTAPCWASGGGTGSSGGSKKTYTYRADVLRMLPVKANGKYKIEGDHTVQVPDTGNSNKTPSALGASLVLVYRHPTKTFRAVVLYDGGYTVDNSTPTMSQKVEGFYDPTGSTASLTHIVGSGQLNKTETLTFNVSTLATNPFQAKNGENWDTATFTGLSAGTSSSVTTGVSASADCLTWGAVIFSTEVNDSDSDGLLDRWEDGTQNYDPATGGPLPNLREMGADRDKKDIFVEVGYLDASTSPTYGISHTHLPPYEALKMVGDAFDLKGINIHFDVGSNYQGSPYIVSKNPRGGDRIDESGVVGSQFPGYPGTVGWKTGFLYLRNEIVGSAKDSPPAAGAKDVCEQPGNDRPGQPCERRFDRNRRHMFRYALFAHFIGLPKSESPGVPDFNVPRTNTGVGDFPGGDLMVTMGAFPDIHGKPVGTPYMQAATLMHELGHNMLLRHGGGAFEPNCKPTYLSVMNYAYQLRGLWDDSGKVNLDFSGEEEAVGIVEDQLQDGQPLTKPYRIGWYAPYSTSYLLGRPERILKRHCDGSLITDGAEYVRIDQRSKTSPTDWNANGVATPAFYTQDVNFNGRTKQDPTSPASPGEALKSYNDWGNLRVNLTGARRNTGGLYIDNAGLQWVGPLSADVTVGDLGYGDLSLSDLGGGRGDLGGGRGDLGGGRGDLGGGRGDLGLGDLGMGDLGGGRGDLGGGRGDLGGGRGDLGRGDLGGGDYFVNNPYPEGELDFETAGDLAKTPPNQFQACVIGSPNADGCSQQTTLGSAYDVWLRWTPPNVGGVVSYIVYRVEGPALTPTRTWTEVGRVPTVPGQTSYQLIDDDGPLVNGQQYTYFAVAVYADGIQSDASNLVTITAVKKVQFVGFLSPLATAGTLPPGPYAPSYSGEHQHGRAVPLKWQLTQGGSFVSTDHLENLEAVPYDKLATGACPTTAGSSPSSDALVLALYKKSEGGLLPPAGSSTYRYDQSNQTFQFNWDTNTTNPTKCYMVVLKLAGEDPQIPKATFVTFK